MFARLGQAGIGARGLDPILLTHLHIDHSGGLAPLVFSAFMEGRTEPITILGPAPGGDQPGVAEFVKHLFGEEGAWRYLWSFEGFGLRPVELPSQADDSAVHVAHHEKGLLIRSVAVPHGMMPSVAYRVDHDGRSIVFSGDIQSGYGPLVDLASDCDVLVHDFALPEREVAHGHLHAKPSEVARVAALARPRRLVLAHVMPELEDELDDALEYVRATYDGDVIIARDLCRLRV